MAVALPAVAGLALSGCAGAGGGGGGGGGDSKSINVLMVGNPQMVDIQKLTEDSFTKDTGIKVNYTVLPENELRDKVTQDVATGAGQYDVATVGAYEVPIWAKNDWLHDDRLLRRRGLVLRQGRPAQADGASRCPARTASSTALPFYGESSFLMYRKDVLKKKGITMPERPTWQQVADIAAKVDGAEPGMKGICLRGLPGWGEHVRPADHGGQHLRRHLVRPRTGQAEGRLAPEFKAGDQLLREPDQGARRARRLAGRLHRVPERDEPEQGRHVVRRHVGRRLARGPERVSKVAGKVGYVQAPVVKTKASGWLWTWALGDAEDHEERRLRVRSSCSWASSKDYEKLVGEKLGWSRVPAGKRTSTYEIPEYKKAAAAFGRQTLQSIEEANPEDPGVQPRPTVGVQFVDIPEFQDLGTKVSQDIAAAIAGTRDRRRGPDQGPGTGRGRRQEVPRPVAQHPAPVRGGRARPSAPRRSRPPVTEPSTAPPRSQDHERYRPRHPASTPREPRRCPAASAGVAAARCCRR